MKVLIFMTQFYQLSGAERLAVLDYRIDPSEPRTYDQ